VDFKAGIFILGGWEREGRVFALCAAYKPCHYPHLFHQLGKNGLVLLRSIPLLVEMHTTMLGGQEWAQQEFALADLGDARRSKRLVQVASALAQGPSGTLPQAFDDWADLKAAYPLFRNLGVSYQKIFSLI